MEEKSSNLSQTDTALPSSENKREKQKNPFKIATIICAIIAIAGIGFGVYKMTEPSKTKCNVSPQDESDNNPDSSSATTAKTDLVTTEPSKREDGYLYFDEFGLKVKLPEDFIVSGYRFSANDKYDGAIKGKYNIYGGTIDISISPEDYADYPLITIARFNKSVYECNASCGEEIYSDDIYMYRVFVRNASIGERDGSVNEELNNVIGSKLFDWYESVFSKAENYSAI
ncbi:hypothetical protein IKG20_02965 [Candidatus Saccharibacteria bacterium]|nr:hypothetical protein [Candidatus Saccharibacteria bacterium]